MKFDYIYVYFWRDMKVRLRDIRLNQLNNRSLTLVAKFARMLRAKKGKKLKLNDENILLKISENVRQTDDHDLNKLYQEIKAEVKIGVFASLKV